MRCEIEKLKTGWFQLYLRFRPSELDGLMASLRRLEAGGHFHAASTDHEGNGVADIEISLMGADEKDNMKLLG
jgi:hypothetical protein